VKECLTGMRRAYRHHLIILPLLEDSVPSTCGEPERTGEELVVAYYKMLFLRSFGRAEGDGVSTRSG
jgi:hypothetical protein